ncbi:MAG: GIY-YIG nuclease family protein [Oscillospiraceae bacterium]|nr:GIY-YIG nuclease family protein [Oscillospiraceae bacterium]
MFVYILSNETNVCLYTGVTNDLVRRLYEHRNEFDPKSFTSQYHVHKLVYYEEIPDAYNAITREKQIKGWNRKRKNKLIESKNPKWEDLSVAWSE